MVNWYELVYIRCDLVCYQNYQSTFCTLEAPLECGSLLPPWLGAERCEASFACQGASKLAHSKGFALPPARRDGNAARWRQNNRMDCQRKRGFVSRREFLFESGGGLSGVALAW